MINEALRPGRTAVPFERVASEVSTAMLVRSAGERRDDSARRRTIPLLSVAALIATVAVDAIAVVAALVVGLDDAIAAGAGAANELERIFVGATMRAGGLHGERTLVCAHLPRARSQGNA